MDNTAEIETFLAGWHAAQAGIADDPTQAPAWRDGWQLWTMGRQ